jgi:hypothetical protein
MNIFQLSKTLEVICEYESVRDVERIWNIPEKTVSSALFKGSLCRGQWYFSRSREFLPPSRLRAEKMGKKFTVMVSDEVWDRLLLAIGQRKKQDIFRNLLLEWLSNEERKHDGEDNKKA